MDIERMWVDWKALKRMGFPYSRQHTYRLIAAGTFPRARKLGKYRGARAVWALAEIRTWAASHDLPFDMPRVDAP